MGFKICMLLVYIIANTYLMWRTLHWIGQCFRFPYIRAAKIGVMVIYIIWALTLILWIAFPKGEPSSLVYRIGNVWYGVLAMCLTLLLIADVVLGIMKLIDKKHRIKLVHNRIAYLCVGLVIMGVTAYLLIYGSINAQQLQVSYYETEIEKSAAVDSLRVVLIADTHIGLNVGCEEMQQVVDQINALEPDVVVIAGDIYDNDFDVIDDPERLQKIFSEIKSTYGVYAIYGNHDVKSILIGGFTIKHDASRDARMEKLLTDSGIQVLKDDVVTIADDSIYLIGRIDGEEPGEGMVRKTLPELTEGLSPDKPLIIVNHEPDDLEDYDACGADVFLGGHTHNGQMFPLNLAKHIKWENPAGYLKVGNMDSYVTQGVGSYGPYIRTFSHSEVMCIDIAFTGK